MRELLDLHERVDDDRLGLAHAVDVVAREVDEHDVLGAVLDRGGELGSEGGVLCGVEKGRSRSAPAVASRARIDGRETGTHQQASCPS